jgi:hypothetical protein
MPQNGEINTQFGVYKSLCCGHEIMVREGVTFPDCKNHRRLTTIWKPVKHDKPAKETIENGRRTA